MISCIMRILFINNLYILIIMSKLPNLQIISRQARSGAGSIAGKVFFATGILTGFLSFY